MPDEHFFLAPEPPSLPPHLLHLLGEVPPAPAALYETKLPAADTAMQAALRSELQGLHGLQGLQGMQGVQGLPMSEGWQGLPLERSRAPGVEGLRLGAGCAAEGGGRSRGEYIDHSALEHLCVSVDWSHGGQGGQAAAGRASLPPAVALSVTHRYRGRVIETVLVKPLAGVDAPLHPAPLPGVPAGPW